MFGMVLVNRLEETNLNYYWATVTTKCSECRQPNKKRYLRVSGTTFAIARREAQNHNSCWFCETCGRGTQQVVISVQALDERMSG